MQDSIEDNNNSSSTNKPRLSHFSNNKIAKKNARSTTLGKLNENKYNNGGFKSPSPIKQPSRFLSKDNRKKSISHLRKVSDSNISSVVENTSGATTIGKGNTLIKRMHINKSVRHKKQYQFSKSDYSAHYSTTDLFPKHVYKKLRTELLLRDYQNSRLLEYGLVLNKCECLGDMQLENNYDIHYIKQYSAQDMHEQATIGSMFSQNVQSAFPKEEHVKVVKNPQEDKIHFTKNIYVPLKTDDYPIFELHGIDLVVKRCAEVKNVAHLKRLLKTFDLPLQNPIVFTTGKLVNKNSSDKSLNESNTDSELSTTSSETIHNPFYCSSDSDENYENITESKILGNKFNSNLRHRKEKTNHDFEPYQNLPLKRVTKTIKINSQHELNYPKPEYVNILEPIKMCKYNVPRGSHNSGKESEILQKVKKGGKIKKNHYRKSTNHSLKYEKRRKNLVYDLANRNSFFYKLPLLPETYDKSFRCTYKKKLSKISYNKLNDPSTFSQHLNNNVDMIANNIKKNVSPNENCFPRENLSTRTPYDIHRISKFSLLNTNVSPHSELLTTKIKRISCVHPKDSKSKNEKLSSDRMHNRLLDLMFNKDEIYIDDKISQLSNKELPDIDAKINMILNVVHLENQDVSHKMPFLSNKYFRKSKLFNKEIIEVPTDPQGLDTINGEPENSLRLK